MYAQITEKSAKTSKIMFLLSFVIKFHYAANVQPFFEERDKTHTLSNTFDYFTQFGAPNFVYAYTKYPTCEIHLPAVIMAMFLHRKWLTIVTRASAVAGKDGTSLKNVEYLCRSDRGLCWEDKIY